jgi:hypothetical protein
VSGNCGGLWGATAQVKWVQAFYEPAAGEMVAIDGKQLNGSGQESLPKQRKAAKGNMPSARRAPGRVRIGWCWGNGKWMPNRSCCGHQLLNGSTF